MTAPRVAIDVSAVPDDPAGAGRYVIELVRNLARRGQVDLTLICRRDDAGRWARLAGGAVVPVVPRERWRRIVFEQVALGHKVAGLGVDVLHSPHYTMPRRPRRATYARVVTIHDMTFFDHPEWHERVKVPVFRRAIRAAARSADAVVCVSDSTAARLRQVELPRHEMHVILHGVDHERFRPDDPAGADASQLARLGIREPFIAFVSTIQPRKDIPSLVRAFDVVAATRPDAQLVIGGARGWSEAASDAAIAASAHADRIVVTGWVPDDSLPALYRRAAAVAYPALAEGFGLVALEAMACGAPLVTTRGTAMEEFVADGALLVDPGDIDALAAALARCLDGDAGVEEARRNGLSIAARYTWDATAAAHEAVYTNLRQ